MGGTADHDHHGVTGVGGNDSEGCRDQFRGDEALAPLEVLRDAAAVQLGGGGGARAQPSQSGDTRSPRRALACGPGEPHKSEENANGLPAKVDLVPASDLAYALAGGVEVQVSGACSGTRVMWMPPPPETWK
jgi:hypothetical protein